MLQTKENIVSYQEAYITEPTQLILHQKGASSFQNQFAMINVPHFKYLLINGSHCIIRKKI